jgi:hypothetical protein
MSVIATTFGGKLVWSFVSQFEVTEGIAAVAFLLLLAVIMESYGFGYLFRSPVLTDHLRSRISYLFAFLAFAGISSYALLVLCNPRKLRNIIDIHGWNVVQYPLNLFGYLGGSAMGQDGRMGYGGLALLTWGLTIVFLSLVVGFTRAVKFFALPSILFLTVVVLLFDPREMDIQAINLASEFTFDGVSLLSNWFLLTVSLFFTVYGLVHERLGVFRKTRAAKARL